jgi:sodium transport system ATP-binding protein
MVDVRRVSKFFGTGNAQVLALDEVSLTIQPGDVFGLVGPNGAGKTTFMRIVSTALTPSTGSGTVCGHDLVTDGMSVRRSIGFLCGKFGFYGRLTGEEHLRYFGFLYGMGRSEIDERIDSLSKQFAMSDFINRRCNSYSAGMLQKLGICRSIIHSPRVLMLDEASSNLDVDGTRSLLEFVETFRGSTAAVIYATHRMSEIERLCNRLAVINRGRCCFIGTPDELKNGRFDHLEDAYTSTLGVTTIG